MTTTADRSKAAEWILRRIREQVPDSVHVEVNALENRDACEVVVGEPGPDQVWGVIPTATQRRLRNRPETEVREYFREYLRVFPCGDKHGN